MLFARLNFRRPRGGPASGCVLFLSLLTSACTEKRAPGEHPDTSPQATALPAPFAVSPVPTFESRMWGDAGIVTLPSRGDQALPSDVAPHDTIGLVLTATFRVPDAAVRRPDDALGKRAEARVNIELSDQRMRVVHHGSGFALPEGAELRARADRYGHAFFVADDSEYRVLPAGALRAFYSDRRRDVAPLGAATVKPLPGASARLGFTTRRVSVETRAGDTTFEVARVTDIGDRGTLVARYLLDLVNAAPQTPLLGIDELPLRAEAHWRDKGTFVFEVSQVVRRAELSQAALTVVPPTARFTVMPFPAGDLEVLVPPKELAALRGAPLEAPPPAPTVAVGAGAPGTAPPVPSGPSLIPPMDARNDLLVHNTHNFACLVVVEGVPVAWVRPQAQGVVSGLGRGRYQVQLRTFLGDQLDTPVTAQVPGVVGLAPDAGK